MLLRLNQFFLEKVEKRQAKSVILFKTILYKNTQFFLVQMLKNFRLKIFEKSF